MTTRRNVGILSPFAAPAGPTRFKSAGEPNMLVGPKSSIASNSFSGSTRAGRVGSIRGTIDVIPSAGANSANRGNVQRSISPGSIW